ncbi:hypothetical protein [Pseudoalteromonas nigrifaciens]|uniref:hypothetical protein n=1 Tax=Pseudoalteromonas nigrifaciens TaxID=28109 RepID=UPI003FD39C6C
MLLEVISPEQYKELRASVIKAFDVNIDTPYTGDVGAELEFGDVSDAVREVTYQRYPEVDDINMPVSLKDRVSWCEAIISVMDDSAATYA